MKALEDHPIAGIFPLLERDELARLKEDIQSHGLRESITLFEGKILDGRNRYRACLETGIAVRTREFSGGDPAAYVVSLNLARRHLSAAQRACCAVEMLPWLEKEAKDRQRSNLPRKGQRGFQKNMVSAKMHLPYKGRSDEKVGKLYRVGHRYVSEAKKLKAEAPALFDQVKSGEKELAEVKRELKREAYERRVRDHQPIPLSKQGPFSLVVADPPWEHVVKPTKSRRVDNQYQTISVDLLCRKAPPVLDDAVLFLWSVAPLLPEALRVMDSWGFIYRTHAVWDKQKIGMGYWFRGQHELILVGTRGQFTPPAEHVRVGSVFSEPRGAHSVKPECVLRWIDRAFPVITKLEMFGRKARPGWIVWGNEL